MERYGIIQFSDLQFGKKHRFGSPSSIAKDLSLDIEAVSQKNVFTPLFLILSGDITETGHANEFREALSAIEEIRNNLSIDKDSVLCIPGNHDINWDLSKIAESVGDRNLKFNNYVNFSKHFNDGKHNTNNNFVSRFYDHRQCVEFLLINTCEKETHDVHLGFIDKDKLLACIATSPNHQTASYTKICVTHHRIDPGFPDKKTSIENSAEIESILHANGYHIVFSGHVHENICHAITKDSHTIIYSGCGSTGVDVTQRVDGIQNQYSIHVIDSNKKTIETFWRAYSPNKRSKYGIGAWTEDNSVEINPSKCALPHILGSATIKEDWFLDVELINSLKIRCNPFTYSNAEKISGSDILDLFVSNEARHKGAIRLTGDAIIRGRRGAGKTMLLKYLNIFGNMNFDEALRGRFAAEVLPVSVDLSRIHSSEWGGSIEKIYDSADKLIFDSVMDALENKVARLQIASFKAAFSQTKHKISYSLKNEGSLIQKLGAAISETLGSYFKHVLLLIDEIAPVFPREFFSNKDSGFNKWMNSIRNSGPYFTRVAVYPNDFSDVLSEDRFGTMVNLEYDVRSEDDYHSYREYCINLVDKYLGSVSLNQNDKSTINDIIYLSEPDSEDALEQLIYASDGSSRRFLSLIDKCLNFYVATKVRVPQDLSATKSVLSKTEILNIIVDYSSNLLAGYDDSQKELAKSISKICKKQASFKFRMPGSTSLLYPLYSKREESNILVLTESGSGRRAAMYEFAYPYCILMDIPTHYLKDTRKRCVSRDNLTGEWIVQATTIEKESLDFFQKENRIEGQIMDIDLEHILVQGNDEKEYLSSAPAEEIAVGDMVSFLIDGTMAYDIVLIKTEK